MSKINQVLLEFDPILNDLGKGKRLAGGLSVVVQIGDTLWVANDETVSLERLTLFSKDTGGNYLGLHHCRFSLADFLKLPAPPDADHRETQEVDVEGLAYDDGYLWLIGSHSIKRKKPKTDDSVTKTQERLAALVDKGNRYLLARIPLVENNGLYSLAAKAEHQDRHYSAGQLHGDDASNELTKALKSDPHLGDFLAIPGKDNGFDIEGLAAFGQRLFIGLRGPVSRGWAVILEVELDDNAKHLKSIGPKQRLYRKHFLQLDGLGIRDLSVHGADLLILAGPSMDLDGPVALFRWLNGAQAEQESVVAKEHLQRIMDIPYGQGEDHPEGMTLFTQAGADAPAVLVVYDSAATLRQPEANTMLADIFALPAI